ncbi:ABC exporter membrane fusion protein [Leptolyngbya boryana CZ1]|uniref:ABC exporter membrane fusion protein n=1 Tax=Leptolyngbya boryana CZ1 TaxID=3060204 RepID=A0AA96WXE9_LEPBY|nr:ABC exporter membrane fusion protein [Leptolyngbya boryana]WNZ47151.1 ABC exporter membrane fusion protein [Leptolyngbya boryana CZ1]
MSLKPLMKPGGARVVLIGSAIALALTGFGIFSYSIFRPTSQSSASPSQQEQSSQPDAVSALGRLEPEGGVIKVSAPSASAAGGFGGSRIERVLVKEGAKVKANQPLAVLDTYQSLLATAMQAEAQVKEAESRLAQVQAGAKRGDINAQRATVLRAQAELPKAEAEYARVDAEFQKAKWDYDRFSTLFKEGAVNESEVRNRKLALDTTEKQRQQASAAVAQAQLEFEGAKQTLESVAEVRPTDVQQAAAGVQVAMANFQRAKADLDKAIVRAPAEGQVLKIHSDPGEVVGNEGVMDLGRTNQMYVVAEIDENFIRRVKPGQRAKITGFAFPGELTGTVDRVGLQVRKNEVLNTDPVDKTDTRVVEVKIRLDNSEPVAGLTNLQVKVVIEP